MVLKLIFFLLLFSCLIKPTLCNPCSMSGFPILYQIPELAQTHVHWVGDAIQPSHPLLPLLLLPSIFPRIRVFSASLFLISGSQSIEGSASVLPVNIEDWFPLGLIGWISLLSKGLSRVLSNTIVQKHQFFAPDGQCIGVLVYHQSCQWIFRVDFL